MSAYQFLYVVVLSDGMIVEGYFGMLLMMIPTINRMPIANVGGGGTVLSMI